MTFEQRYDIFKTAVRLASSGDYAGAAGELDRLEGAYADAAPAGGRELELYKNILFQRAICAICLDNGDTAASALKRLLDITEDAAAYDLLAGIYIKSCDYEAARVCYGKLAAIDPSDICSKLREARYDKDCAYERFLRTLDEADEVLAGSAFLSKDGVYKAQTYAECFHAAVKLLMPERALAYFDAFAAEIPAGARASYPLYKEMLRLAFGYIYYTEHYTDDDTARLINEMRSLHAPARENKITPKRRAPGCITVALVSSDFRYHPIGRFINALFSDAPADGRVRYYCYSINAKNAADSITELIRAKAGRYTDIAHMSDDEAEALILNDAPDILIDLNGIAEGGRRGLIMRRLAPVQISWLGFPSTCAVKNIDCQITDRVTDPPGLSERFYTERLLYMPETFLCYPLHINNEGDIPQGQAPPFLNNGYITFASFSNALKFTPRTVRMWAGVLERVPGSRLLIRNSSVCGDIFKETALTERLKAYGIDTRRVILKPEAHEFSEYMRFYGEADIILDTYPFNGATTTCDAFTAGVPVVSRYGAARHAGRVGLSLLTNVGLSDLAADSDGGFTETAVNLAADTERLVSLRKSLPGAFAASPLTDTRAFKKAFEDLLYGLCETRK